MKKSKTLITLGMIPITMLTLGVGCKTYHPATKPKQALDTAIESAAFKNFAQNMTHFGRELDKRNIPLAIKKDEDGIVYISSCLIPSFVDFSPKYGNIITQELLIQMFQFTPVGSYINNWDKFVKDSNRTGSAKCDLLFTPVSLLEGEHTNDDETGDATSFYQIRTDIPSYIMIPGGKTEKIIIESNSSILVPSDYKNSVSYIEKASRRVDNLEVKTQFADAIEEGGLVTKIRKEIQEGGDGMVYMPVPCPADLMELFESDARYNLDPWEVDCLFAFGSTGKPTHDVETYIKDKKFTDKRLGEALLPFTLVDDKLFVILEKGIPYISPLNKNMKTIYLKEQNP